MWRFCSSSIRGSIIWVVIWMSPVGASGLTRGCSSRGPVSSQAISSDNDCQRGTDREQFPAAENPSFVPSPPSLASKSTPQRAWIGCLVLASPLLSYRNRLQTAWMRWSWRSEPQYDGECDMRWTGVVAIAVATLAIPAMAFAQGAPVGAWCGGSYWPQEAHFRPCPAAHGGGPDGRPAAGIP